MNIIKPYRDEVVQQIKEAGQELIDRAESLIGEGADMIADVKITIQIGMSVADDKMPEIKVETLYGNRKTFDRWCGEGKYSKVTILSKGGIK